MIKLYNKKIGKLNKYFCSLTNTIFDSEGEVFIYLWLVELLNNNVIEWINEKPTQKEILSPVKRNIKIQLKTKSKIVNEHVASSLKYTPDFIIKWKQKAYKLGLVVEFNSEIKKPYSYTLFSTNGISILECKPDGLNCKKAPDKNMTRLFISKQKCIYNNTNEWINLIFHNQLFKNTFTPERYIMQNKNTLRKRGIKYEIKIIKEFING